MKCKNGETLTETLVSVLIIALIFSFVSTVIVEASRANESAVRMNEGKIGEKDVVEKPDMSKDKMK